MRQTRDEPCRLSRPPVKASSVENEGVQLPVMPPVSPLLSKSDRREPGSRRSVSSSNATPRAILRNIHVVGLIAEIDTTAALTRHNRPGDNPGVEMGASAGPK